LHEEQRVKGLSRGERMKLLLALALARRPRLLVLDEPTAGLDPVARHEVLAELMSVVEDERRGILFSSHNTQDVEQTSDRITFIDRGSIIESSDKETFLDRRRRLHLAVPADACLPVLPGVIDLSRTGQLAVATANAYTPEIAAAYERAGATVCDVQRMTLEEIFVATVSPSRHLRDRGRRDDGAQGEGPALRADAADVADAVYVREARRERHRVLRPVGPVGRRGARGHRRDAATR